MNRTLTRKKAQIEPYELIVGVDVGKRHNQAVLVNRQWRVLGQLRFAQSRAGYEHWAQWLERKKQQYDGAPLIVGLEPTNDYWCWLAHFMESEGLAYRLVNPFTVKRSREGAQLDAAKDDPRDSWTIARLVGEGQYTETQLLAGVYQELRQVERAHWRLRGLMRQQKTVLRQTVERLFPELHTVFDDYTGLTCQALLTRHADPSLVSRLGEADFVRAVRQDFRGRRLQISKLRQVQQLANHSIGLPCGAPLQLLIRQQLTTYRQQQRQLAELEQALVAAFRQLPAATRWLSLGLGEVTTALVVAELGNLDRFRQAQQLVKLAGTQPTPNRSGQQRRQRTPMSRKGRPRLRTYLFFATLRLLSQDPAFRARRMALVERAVNPLPPMAAVGVLMNKLLHLFWALCHGTDLYQADRFMPVH